MSTTPEECAQCGASIPPGARACPECGANERTGWAESSIYDGLDLPDEAWADEDSDSRPLPRELPWYWWAAGIATLIALLLWVLS
jgi:hypothetical protein